MPRIIAKFGYMKPNNKSKSQFVEYIARRDGVIKNIQKNLKKLCHTTKLHVIKNSLSVMT